MPRETKPRDRNRYAQGCIDCPTYVQPGEGFLYRHSGANCTKSIRRNNRAKFTYVVRCAKCAAARKDERVDTAVVTSGGGGYGIQGYSEACGVWN